MTQSRRSEPTEQSPTVLSPDELTRLRRLFGGMPYMLMMPAQLDPGRCTTVDDLIKILESLQKNVVAAAASAEQTRTELYDLRSTVRGGARFLALLRDMEVDS